MTKDQGLYNKPLAAVHLGALAARTLPQYNTIQYNTIQYDAIMYKNSVINEKIHHSKWIKSGHIKMKNINRNLSDKKQIVSFWKTTTILSFFKFVCVCVCVEGVKTCSSVLWNGSGISSCLHIHTIISADQDSNSPTLPHKHWLNYCLIKHQILITCLENFHIQLHKQNGKLICQQMVRDPNPLYEIMHDVQLQHACV